MKNRFHSFMKKLIIILFPALFLYGCGIWGNFITYFNLYYNAADLFEQAEQAIQNQKRDLFSTEPLNLPGNSRQLLVKVTEKCSKILQFHSKTSYVDDALLMLGKAFFYQNNYQKALRKFRELISTQPNSDLILETNLWIGKTEMRLRNYDNGLAKLKSVREEALKEDENKIVQDAYIEEIKYRIGQLDVSGAINLSNDLLKISENDELNAEVVYELGKLYKQEDDIPNAVNAFAKVTDYSPTYDTKYNSLIQLGEALREDGKNEKALGIFEDMRSEAKYSDKFSEIDLQRGITEISLKHYNEGDDLLKTVDTAYSSTPSAGIARYELGLLYENHYLNFDSAAAYYSKAISSSAPDSYMSDIRQKNDLFNRYHLISDRINNDQKQLVYIADPQQFVQDSIAYFEKQKEEMEKSKEEKKTNSQVKNNRNVGNNQRIIPNQARGFQPNRIVNKSNNLPPKRPELSADSLTDMLIKNEFELGNMFLTELNIPDSAYYYYTDILNNYPNSAYQARTLYALGSYYLTMNNQTKADSLFNIIYKNFRSENIVNAAADKLGKPLIDLNYDPAKYLYDKAEVKMDSAKYDSTKFDSTLISLYSIAKKHPKSPYAAKSLYASGWILENKLDLLDSAAVVYDTLASEYPQSVYAKDILQKLRAYKDEKARELKEKRDSLNAKNDSSKTLASDSLKSKRSNLTNASKISLKKKEQAKQELQKEEAKSEALKKAEERKRQLSNNNTVNPDTLIRRNIRGHSKNSNK